MSGRFYVDVTDVSDEFLEFMGYTLVTENAEFQLRDAKGEPVILSKSGIKYLYVEDMNDAIVFRARAKVAVPPKGPPRSVHPKRRPRRKRK